MATEKLDPRAALAKMEAEEKAVREAADKLCRDFFWFSLINNY